MSIEHIKSSIRTIPDFPIKGILFWDITTMFKEADCLQELGDELYKLYADKGVTKVVGLESRGFLMGTVLATRVGAGFVMCRKMGKLPGESIKQSYVKEYGYDTIEIHTGAISSDDVVVIHDDLLASGGTMKAAYDLVKKFNPKKIYVNSIIELEKLNGRARFPEGVEITSVIKV